MSVQLDLADAKQNGAYFVGAADLDALDAGAHADGLTVRRASLLGCRDKADLLARIAAMLDFPQTFAGNWDALADSLRDLAWLPGTGYALLFDHAGDLDEAAAADFDTALDVTGQVAGEWRTRGTPFFAFFALPDDAFGEDEEHA